MDFPAVADGGGGLRKACVAWIDMDFTGILFPGLFQCGAVTGQAAFQSFRKGTDKLAETAEVNRVCGHFSAGQIKHSHPQAGNGVEIPEKREQALFIKDNFHDALPIYGGKIVRC